MKKIEYPSIIQCLECKEVLVSNYTHDFVRCGCKNQTFVDGGKAYLRCGGKKLELIQVLKISKARVKK